ncbi:MAG: Beta-hexosaminidase [Chlamydiae bacterium]|nr:Beta-hexosaminidase [Chlamydiota bacterium]
MPICPTHGEKHIEKVHKLLKERHIESVIFMAGTSEDQKRILQLLDMPLLTFQDAEWGVGMRLADIPPSPKNLTLGAIQDLGLLRAFGRELARQCLSVGIDCPLAPVVDVNSNPKNPVIGKRSFGDDPHEVAFRALAVMEGMRQGGILACAKHFPGHGDTAVDSHLSLPKIDKSLEDIENAELVPFHALIDAGVDLVMVGHLQFPALSVDPSSLSYEIITELLREKLGFEGVVITDALNMRALSLNYSIEEVVTKTLLAGTDLLLTADFRPDVIDYLIDVVIPRAIDHIIAIIPEELIDQKLERIRALHKTHSEIPGKQPELCRTLYRHAITRIGKEIPLGRAVALVQNQPDPIFENFLRSHAEVLCFSYAEMEKASAFPHVIVQVGPNDFPSELPEHAIVALFDVPYKLAAIPQTAAVIGYEDVPFAKEAVADVLFGKIPALGKLPIQVYE